MNYTWNVARMSQDPWIKNFLFFFHSAGQLLYTRNYDSLLSIYHLDSPHIITYYYNTFLSKKKSHALRFLLRLYQKHPIYIILLHSINTSIDTHIR